MCHRGIRHGSFKRPNDPTREGLSGFRKNHLPKMKNENLLVTLDTSDDAAVYKLNDEIALVQTLDFFTPVVRIHPLIDVIRTAERPAA